MENKNDSFEFTYSAEQQAEIDKIKSKYMPKVDSKLEQLRKLDASVTQKATLIGVIVGVIGCLIFGGGLSMILVVGMSLLLPGSILGIVGLAGMILALPVYKNVLEKERERVAPQILALTEELGQ